MAVAYYLVCILLPSGLLKSYVKNRSLAFRVIFYQIVSNLYITAWGFALSFTHLYYSWSVWLTVILLPLGLLCYKKRAAIKSSITNLVSLKHDHEKGFAGGKYIRRRVLTWLKTKASAFYRAYLKGNLVHVVVILAIAVFVVLFYGYFKLHHYSYGHTDEETHLYWIQSLIHNNPFPAGMYPHAMHFLAGALITLIGAPVVSLWLNFSMVSTLLIHITAYLFLNRIFKNKAPAIAGMGLFLVLNIFSVESFYRLQYSIPMEFGMTAMFAMLFALVSFLEDHSRISLITFGMALIWTFEAHFYVTIFCAFLCLAVGVVYLVPLFRSKTLHKILICGALSLALAIAPYGIGYACGFTFERSISWALDVMQEESVTSEQNDGEDDTVYTEISNVNTSDPDFDEETFMATLSEEEQEYYLTQKEYRENFYPVYDEMDDTQIQDYYKFYDFGSEISKVRNVEDLGNLITMWAMYSLTRTSGAWRLLVGLWIFTMVYAGILLVLSFCRRGKDKGPLRERALRYLLIGAAALAGFICYCSYFTDLPTLMYPLRAAVFESMLCIPLLAMPVQAVCDIAGLLFADRKKPDAILSAAAFALVGVVCVIAPELLKSTKELYYNFAIDDADMRTCVQLLDSGDDFNWTVISPTNDLSAIRYNGYHYEIADLLTAIEDGEEEIYIPTRDIYVVVEKKIVNFNYIDNRYVDDRNLLDYTVDINPESARLSLDELGRDEWSTSDRIYYEGREVVMSKLYYWMEKIKEVYPAETEVYYEDETCCVYHLSQDPYFLLNLAVDYTDVIPEAENG